MKKFIKIITITMVLLAGITIYSQNQDYKWGTSYEEFLSTIDKSKKIIAFKPSEKPRYKNIIMNYITAIDAKFKTKISILRVDGDPKIDYMFINKKFYSVLIDYGKIDNNSELKIIKDLNNKYGTPSIQKSKDFFIYAYTNQNLKILFYRKKINNKIKCKEFIYAKKLFRMLLME